LTYLIILREPKGSVKSEVSEKLKERLYGKHKNRIYFLKFEEINDERFKKILDEALDKSCKYVIAELNSGESHSTGSITHWCFKDKHYQIVSFVLVGRKEIRLQRCKNYPKRNPFDLIVIISITIRKFSRDLKEMEVSKKIRCS
jgi:hypothetical protein